MSTSPDTVTQMRTTPVQYEPRLGHDPKELDPRTQRMLQRLFSAAASLAARPEAFSVRTLVEAAGVSRSAFYAHFADLNDFASAFLAHNLSDIRRQVAAPSGRQSRDSIARNGYERLVAHLVAHFEIYRTALAVDAIRTAYERFVASYAIEVFESAASGATLNARVNARVAAVHTAGGVASVLVAWLLGAIDLSDDEIVDQLVALTPTWLQTPPAALDTAQKDHSL